MKHESVSAGEQYLKCNLTNRFFLDARLSREFSIREPDLVAKRSVLRVASRCNVNCRSEVLVLRKKKKKETMMNSEQDS